MPLVSNRLFALLLSVAVILTPFQGALAGFGSITSGGIPDAMSDLHAGHQMQQPCADETSDCCQQQADMTCLNHCSSHFAPAIISGLPTLPSTALNIAVVTLPDLYTIQPLSELYRPPRA